MKILFLSVREKFAARKKNISDQTRTSLNVSHRRIFPDFRKKLILFIPMKDFENRMNFAYFELSLENGYFFLSFY